MRKPRPAFVIPMLAGVVGAFFWLVLRWSSTRESAAAASGNQPVAGTMEKAVVAAGKFFSHLFAQVSGEGDPQEFGTEAFKKDIVKRCAKWMESRNRDAASLVAMWTLTGDENLLDEAAEKFPGDARVCVAMINRLLANGDAGPWVDRLIAAEPGNPAGWYWKAQLLGKSGKAGEALEALRRATGTKGQPPDTHLRDNMLTVREAALAGGSTSKEAAMLALAAPFSKNGLPAAGGTMKFLRTEIQAASDAGNPDRAAEIAGLGAAAAEHLGMMPAHTLMDDMVRVSMLRAMLPKLDLETEFGSDGKTVGMRLTEVNAETAELTALMQNGDYDNEWSRLTEAQAAEYTDRFILHGEWSARKWLNSRTATPPPTENEPLNGQASKSP